MLEKKETVGKGYLGKSRKVLLDLQFVEVLDKVEGDL